MNVLQINAVYGAGSTGRTTKELDEYLQAKGHNSYAAVSETDIYKPNVHIIGNRLDKKAHALLSRLFGKQGYFSVISTIKTIKYISECNPDIVHLRNLHANYINIPLLLKYLAKKDIATVVTLHDCFIYTGKCTHYTIQGCYKWQTGCYACPKLKEDNASWFFDRTRTMWHDKKKYFAAIPRLAVVGVSDWITQEARQSLFKDAKILQRIYNWIDLSIFYPREICKNKCVADNSCFTVLFMSAGWDVNSNKFKDVINLAEKLGKDVKILVAGSGLEDVELPDNICALGYISGTNELAQLYSSVDVYVHMSYEDTFGKVIAEAMACGTPVIVYDSTALPELVSGGCGYVVPKGDIDSVYNSILEIRKNGKKAYSQACIDKVNNSFSKELCAQEYINLYEQLSCVVGNK